MATHPIRFGYQSGQQNVTWERMRDFWRNLDAWVAFPPPSIPAIG